MSKHLIVVSVDALVFEDIENTENLPFFSKLLKNGAAVKRVRSIYPTSTHPVHASIITGVPAGKTGVPANEMFLPESNVRPWYNYLSQLKTETVFHAAKRAGLTTAACRWPLTANGNDVIDYLIPEVMNSDSVGFENDMPSVYRKLGTTECVMDIVEAAAEKFGYSHSHPEYDAFENYCAAEIIRRYKPNMLFTHPGYVDSARHKTGLFSDKVSDAVRQTDKWLCDLYEAAEDAGIIADTDFIVLSDHGHLNYSRFASPNMLFADAGLISTDNEGKITHWDAYATRGLISYVHLSRPDDTDLYNKVYTLLKEKEAAGIYGFEKVFTRGEVTENYGLDGDFSFILETDGITSFKEFATAPYIRYPEVTDFRYGHSGHGYLPHKGPQPVFIGMGPDFKQGVAFPEGSILDFAPTFAEIFGFNLPCADGKPEKRLLNI